MINDVEVLLATLLGLSIGLAYGPVTGWLRRRAQADLLLDQRPEVSPQLAATVDLLRSAALVAGPYDEVMHSNPQARSLGLARGTRISPDALLEMVRGVRHRGQPLVTTYLLRREPGTPSTELAIRITAMDGGIVLLIADDRSALVRTEEIKRDFVANVSHELNTPVGALRVLAEAVDRDADEPEAVKRFAGEMITESERLSQLVQQIIALSRVQSTDPMLHPEVVEVDDVVRAAAESCAELAHSRSVNLTTSGTPGLQVLGDLEQLTGAVVNLILNAINYSDTGARVAVTTRSVSEAGDEFVEIAVADNGIGIRSDELERIFERFYRVDYERSRAHGGSGLGLSLVKHIMGAHGGTVNVWSKVGQGSTFTLQLPAHDDQAVMGEESS